MNWRDKLAAVRLILIKKFEFYTGPIYFLVEKECPGLGTLGVTKNGILLVDPEILDKWTEEECAAVLEHEINHVLRKHHTRQEEMQADPKLFNIAGDLSINTDLVKSGTKLPGKFLHPKVFGFPEGLTAEEYYDLLKQEQQKQQQGGKGDCSCGDHKDHKKDCGSQGDSGEPQQGQDKPQAGGGWCGSCAGRSLPGEPENDPDGRTETEMDKMRRDTAEAVREAESKNRGSMPAGLARWAEALLQPPKVKWQDKLARFARQALSHKAGQHDYTYTKPSRRSSGEFILPSMYSPVPNVLFVLDTSGSMGTQSLSVGWNEAKHVIKATGASISFMAIDAAVHSLKRVSRWQDIGKLIAGGGGTDFRPAFEQALHMKPKPDILVFFTDGQGIAPTKAPKGIRTIWCLTTKCKPCNWGYFVEVEI